MTDRPNDIPIGELRENLSEVTDEVARGRRFIVTRNRKARMALVPVADLEWLEELEEKADLAAIRARAHEKPEDWEAVKARLGL